MDVVENRTFLITGSTDGIGLHTAQKVTLCSHDQSDNPEHSLQDWVTLSSCMGGVSRDSLLLSVRCRSALLARGRCTACWVISAVQPM